MERITKENGREHWVNVTESDLFSDGLFYEVDMSYSETDQQVAFHSNIGSITVLTRLTGFGYFGTETGFRDTDGKFWLASGNFDIRELCSSTIGEAISCIKNNANNMRGD